MHKLFRSSAVLMMAGTLAFMSATTAFAEEGYGPGFNLPDKYESTPINLQRMTAKRHTTRLSSLRANVHKLFWPITARYGLTPGVKSFTLVHLKESTEKSMWKEKCI